MEIYDLVYKNDKSKDFIRILGNDFFNRNKIAGYFIYNNVRYRL